MCHPISVCPYTLLRASTITTQREMEPTLPSRPPT